MRYSGMLLSLMITAFVAFVGCKSNPVSTEGQAPAFTLPAADGTSVSLNDLLDDRTAAVLLFYRGFF